MAALLVVMVLLGTSLLCVGVQQYSLQWNSDARIAATAIGSSTPTVSPDTCKQGYVWRQAVPGDHVCVIPETRAQAQYDNSQAPSRVADCNIQSCSFGPYTCIMGYVWRQAVPGDYVCVIPETRTQAQDDNSQAPSRVVWNVSPIAYPPHNTSPVLNDPLQDNSEGYQWEVDTSKGNCKFINQAYDINTHGLEWCPAMATDFANFIYEVQMKIAKGDGGGIAFRIDPTDEHSFYYFAINQDGSYSAHAYNDNNGDDTVLAQGSSPVVHRGLNQTNLVAAVVRGNIIELYVNHKRVAVVGSSTYAHGRIGVIVTGDDNHQTEVIFQNANVWKV